MEPPSSDGSFLIETPKLRSYQATNRNITPLLVVHIPKEIYLSDEGVCLCASLVNADPPYEELPGGLASGNNLFVTGLSKVTFRDLRIAKKRQSYLTSNYW